MPEVQFEVTTDLAVLNQINLEANFEQLDRFLEEKMAGYMQIAVTPESLQAAKADRAEIRRIVAQVEDARKTVARIYKKPLERFETRVKQSLAVCDKADDYIDKQIRFFTNKAAEEKLAALQEFFHECVPEEMAEWLTFAAIKNPKWRNVTFKLDDAKKEILAAIEKIQEDLETIKGLESEFETELILAYQESRNLSHCIRKDAALRAGKKRAEAYAAKKAAEREEAERQAVAERKEEEVVEEIVEQEVVLDVYLKVSAKPTQLTALVAFMRENGIRFSKVKAEE